MGCINSKVKTKKFQVEVDEVATPYSGKLESLKTGDVITVQGLVHPECERYISLKYLSLFLSIAFDLY